MQQVVQREPSIIQFLAITDLSKLICPFSNPSSLICCQQYCFQSSAFVCNDLSCPCRKQIHKNCCFYQIKSLVDKLIQQKSRCSRNINEVFSEIEKIYNQLIERLSIQRDEMLDQVQNFGLKKCQIQFADLISHNKLDKISGSMIKMVFKQAKNSGYTSAISKKQIEKMNTQITEPLFVKLAQSLRSMAFKFESAIIQNQEDSKTLQSFIDPKFVKFKLLYRASQFNGSIPEFRSKVQDAQDTLVLIKTQTNKIVGGFTPLNWQQPFGYKNSYKQDKKNASFIFSVTQKSKYTCIKPQKAIFSRKNLGPCFGKDIKIGARTEDNNFSFPCLYDDEQTAEKEATLQKRNKQQDELSEDLRKIQLREKFCGSKNGKGMRIKQWEIFQLLTSEDLKIGQKKKSDQSRGKYSYQPIRKRDSQQFSQSQ